MPKKDEDGFLYNRLAELFGMETGTPLVKLTFDGSNSEFRVTKVDHKSNSKERKSLMSVTGVEGVNGEMPATPAKQDIVENTFL
ncbi:hypothetical protein HGM15179_006555 [Zosterops borbonicus]|uniref:Uncharacterized protein n=1 Tax=Zosterops borbonicus TaxID=364589 RepID=A0A8K1GMD0_9PASS|nr:hypothetical protein HGM15179_006555 [Zosterops borbonicus]